MATFEKRITKDGKISYRAKIRLKNYPSQTATFEKLSDAKNWARSMEVSLKEGKYFKSQHQLKELIDKYISEILPQKRDKSQINQKIQLLWWRDKIGEYLLLNIIPSIIVSTRSKLLPNKPATLNSYCAALSHMFTIAVKEWGWMEENPVLKISKLKEPRGRTRYLLEEERVKLLNFSKESSCDVLYLLIVLALSTGARKMEIRSLKWEDVNLEKEMIILHDTKNGEKRSIPLVGIAKSLMQDHFIDRNPNTNLVFPSKNLKMPIDIREPFEKALRLANIKDFKWHDLRHSCASYLAMNGASLAEIAAVLGHKTLSMVKRYSHLSEAHTAKVVERMNHKIFGN